MYSVYKNTVPLHTIYGKTISYCVDNISKSFSNLIPTLPYKALRKTLQTVL